MTMQTQNKNLNLSFPSNPDTFDEYGNDLVVDNDDGTVTMPANLFIEFADYVNYVNQEKKIYEAWKNN